VTELRDALKQTASSKDLAVIDVPEWERKVYIRKLTIKDQMRLADEVKNPVEMSVRILLTSLCDENGERELSDDDLDLLTDQPVSLLLPLLTEAARINGLTSAELEEAMASFGNSPGEDRSTE
jgi:hypothetical protein